MQRASGVLAPVFSLTGDFGIGSLGKEAYRFLDFLQAGGFRWWQTLPLCLPAEGNSPYSAYSAFSYHYAFIDLPSLWEEGLLTQAELVGARLPNNGACAYERLGEERFALLAAAAARLRDRDPVYDYLRRHPETEGFCRFMALRRENGGRPLSERKTDRYDEEYYFAWAFTQYTFARQWEKLHRAAETRGIRILGDMPIYVNADSADEWASPHLFQRGEDGRPASVAGVPPDAFSEDGQLWGNPLYDWEALAREDYRWWCRRMELAFSDFDGVRIDHFRAFASYYAIPATATTARSGEWRPGPGRPLIDRLRAVAGDRLLVAEDLGGDTQDVKDLLAYSGFPGMRVFQFADPYNPFCPHMPQNYPENAVAYTGTHDNDTLLGYLLSCTPERRRAVFAACGYAGADVGEGFGAILQTLYASRADLVILPVQDLFRLPSAFRTNRPGIAAGNWLFRMTEEELTRADPSLFRRLAEESGRAAG